VRRKPVWRSSVVGADGQALDVPVASIVSQAVGSLKQPISRMDSTVRELGGVAT